MFKIVQFQPCHQAGMEAVILPIQREEFGIAITLEDQPDLLDIQGFYQRGTGNFWLALSGGEVVGTISLLDIGSGQGALRKMFVKEPFRGRSYGIGSRLLAVLMDWCIEQRVHEVFLGTTGKFLAAHRFYEKNGFIEIQQSCLPPAFPVMAVDTKFYRCSTAVLAPSKLLSGADVGGAS